jgi:cytochrome P450
MTPATVSSRARAADPSLSLSRLMDPDVLADPYPFYHRLRREDPIHWDPFLHAWLVTRYADVVHVLTRFSAQRQPSPEQLRDMGLGALTPVAELMVRQMIFLDPPSHTRLRALCAHGFTPRRIAHLRESIEGIVDELIDAVEPTGRLDVINDLAAPMPAIVTAGLLGVPREDHGLLKDWSVAFGGALGNFQHNPDSAASMLASTGEMTEYFRAQMRELRARPREGLIHALLTAEVEGDRLTDEEIIANCVITMAGAQETTMNLIGNGLLALLRHPEQMDRLRRDPELMTPAVEELLRFDSPSHVSARLAPDDVELDGRAIKKRQAVITLVAAANRDPERFPEPDRLDLARPDNRHVAFGWGSHFCFGAPLARMEGQVAFATLLRRFPELELEPGPLVWRQNTGLRGLEALPVSLGSRR